MDENIPRFLSLVCPREDDIPRHGQRGGVLVFFGEIPQMPGHCVVADQATGEFRWGLHTDRFRELTDDET